MDSKPVRMFHAEWCQAFCTQRGQLYVLQQNGNIGVVGFVNARCEKKQWNQSIGRWLRLKRDSLPLHVTLSGEPTEKDNSREPVFLLRGEIPVDDDTTDIVLSKVSVAVHPGAR